MAGDEKKKKFENMVAVKKKSISSEKCAAHPAAGSAGL